MIPDRLSMPLSLFPAVDPGQAFLVGGSIRDLLLARQPVDHDIVVADDPCAFARRTAERFSARVVALGRAGFRVYRIATPALTIDVAPLAGESIEADLRRRDFTVNAMAADLATGEIIDPANGRTDLRRGRIRMVSAQVFQRDPVRLIRAFRLAGELAFTLEPETLAAVSSQAELIAGSAGERIWAELYKILSLSDSHRLILQMSVCRLLLAVLPELASRYDPGRQPDGLIDTTLAAYGELERLLIDPSAIFAGEIDSEGRSVERVPPPLLKLTLLLQASVTPTACLPPAERSRACAGCEGPPGFWVASICRRLKTSRRQADAVAFLVRYRRRLPALYRAARRNRLSEDARTRFFMLARRQTPDFVLLAAACCAAAAAGFPNERAAFERFARDTMSRYLFDYLPRAGSAPLLTGKDLIACLGLSPSRQFRRLLSAVETARLSGRIVTRQEARRLVEELVRRKQPRQG
jgi:hypothetical protein